MDPIGVMGDSTNGLKFIVVDDIELRATDPLELEGPWLDGTEESLALASTDGVLPGFVAWWPVVGPVDGARLGWSAYSLQSLIAGGAETTTTTIRRVPMASDAALVWFWHLGESPYYTVQVRVEAEAFGAPIPVDNVRTLAGEYSVTFSRACGTLTTVGSPAADQFMIPLYSTADSMVWTLLLPANTEINLPSIEGFHTFSGGDSQFFEIDVTGHDYLDAGDDSTIPRPPLGYQSRHGYVRQVN